MTRAQSGGTRAFQAGWLVFWVAFLLRLGDLTLTHVSRALLDKYADHRSLGWEMGRIAHALVTGHGYADPFFGHTGPTAWVAPLYPLLMAAVFKVFGDYSLLSGWVILALNCLFFALITRTIYEIGARCFSRRTALWSAWIWAFYPAMMLFVVWDTILSTCLLSLILVLALRMRAIGGTHAAAGSGPDRADPRTLRRWLWFGFLWALLGLSDPSLLLLLPAAGIWILAWTPNPGHAARGRQLRFAGASALLFVLCIAPWVARNWVVFHQFIPMRTNFGAELYLGNGPGASGFAMTNEQPFQQSPEQFRLYRRMGEVAYSRMRGEAARRDIASNPWHFVRNTLRRFTYFWFGGPVSLHGRWVARAHQAEHAFRYPIVSILGLLGLALALKRRIPGSRLFLWAFVLIPLVYYFVAVDERFRFPLDPLIAILAVYLFQSIFMRREGIGRNLRPSTVGVPR